MHNITLVATVHSEKGKCNSEELYKILDEQNPEVIFDELPVREADFFYSDAFEAYYTSCILSDRRPPEMPLEVKSIRKYIEVNRVEIVPVDIGVIKKTTEQQNETLIMFSKFFEDEEYQKLYDEKENLIAQEGFDYLNSHRFLDFLTKKEFLERKIMHAENEKDRIFDIYNTFQTEQRTNREKAMLERIYEYSKGSEYHKAVFLIGAEHKKSIAEKIAECENLSGIKLNWTMYGGN